jgi:hypothetical protein
MKTVSFGLDLGSLPGHQGAQAEKATTSSFRAATENEIGGDDSF